MRVPTEAEPFIFRDGRVYEVLEARLLEIGEVRLCEIEVLEQRTQEYREFQAFFCGSFFSDEVFPAEDKEGLMMHARRRIAAFLLENRQHVAFSRAMTPVTWWER